MGSQLLKHIVRFIFFILLQVLVANKINVLDGYMLPYIYIFAILMLPFETPRLLLLLIGFVTGLVLDSFTNTLGMHTIACTTLAFLQPLVAGVLAPREGYEYGDRPTIQNRGLVWYLMYAGVLIVAHHTVLFFVEIFRLTPFFFTFGKALCSSAATLLLCLLAQYLIFQPAKRTRS